MKPRALSVCVLVLGACAGPRPEGLGFTEPGPGPTVIFDLDALPLPELPLPNDVATRPDPSAGTGRRVNLSLEAETAIERRIRRVASNLEGFSSFGAVTVSFDAPLDLDNLVRRHKENRDFGDDAVYLINLDRASPRYGEAVLLDFDQGNFPAALPSMDAYWENDPRAHVANLLFDTTAEDRNGNGRLDPGEDTDGDGLLDVPNVHPVGADPRDHLLTFYEKVTNTLIAKPVVPLDQETRYAVVLTKRLVGADGHAVRSPFSHVNHLKQTEALKELPELLPRHGLTIEDVAFAWSFTTQPSTRDLEALRRGLYGVGPFSYLAREFEPKVRLVKAYDGRGGPYRLPGSVLQTFVRIVGPVVLSMGMVQSATAIDSAGVLATGDSYDNVDYVVLGDFEGPNLLADQRGLARPGYPADEEVIWELDRTTGHARYGRHTVPFWCVVPRKDRGSGAPFPVVVYTHGYGTSRVELFAFAGYLARYGLASCAIDGYGHGLVLPADYMPLARLLTNQLKMTPTLEAISPGRARDLNNDGRPDNGGDAFTLDLFHTRDLLRQSILDNLTFTRVLRSFDGVRMGTQDLNGDGKPELAGDFDGDGKVDLGGPAVDYFSMGSSMGGVLSAMYSAVEPVIVASVPSSGGGGLDQIPGRTVLGAISEKVVLRTMGPIYVGMPTREAGHVDLVALLPGAVGAERRVLVRGLEVQVGDRVEVRNLASGKRAEALAGERGRFRVHLASNAIDALARRRRYGIDLVAGPKTVRLAQTEEAGDRIEVRVFAPGSNAPRRVVDRFAEDVTFEGLVYPAGAPLVALAEGLGYQRNTPDLRRLFGLGQLAMDPADPINYARHIALEPLHTEDYERAQPGASVCILATAGDTILPVSTTAAMARAAGALEYLSPDPRFGRPANNVLIDGHVLEGIAALRRFNGLELVADPEDYSNGKHVPEAPRLAHPMRLTRETGRGLIALRIPLINPKGQHTINLPEPNSAFDTTTLLLHMIGHFFRSRGRELREEACMATQSCPWIPPSSPRAPENVK
ncbi:MAG: hypothetical protein IT371_31430 [Deltaproteobacteria bacterium]|nr:hypothetical protein [Deltaproteobacteria bacterium]